MVAEGTPEDLTGMEHSQTGSYLRGVLPGVAEVRAAD